MLAAILVAGGCQAAECGAANSELITLTKWSASPGDYGAVNVSMDFKSHTSKPIRMLKANVLFADPFGDQIANLSLDPDVVIPADAEYNVRGSWSAARLAKVRTQDVTAMVCVVGVLYEDGSKEVFE